MNKYQRNLFEGILEQLDLRPQRANIISGFTNGRSSSTKDMTYNEVNKAVKWLMDERDKKCKKTRNLIIYKLCLMGYKTPVEKPDFKRIDLFIQNIGSNNSKKKKLIWLKPADLNKVASQVNAMYQNTINRDKATT